VYILTKLLAVAASVSLMTACGGESASPTDTVISPTVKPDFVSNTDGSAADGLAATAVTDLQSFWHKDFPRTFGRPWRPVAHFDSVDSSDAAAPPAPCTTKASDLEGNALYCAETDTVSWDRAAFIPVLHDKFGSAAVIAVLAHEIGHAVEQRAGQTAAHNGKAYPPAVTESIADCYAGSALRWITDGNARHLHVTERQLDGAVRALTTFRDPTAGNDKTHGDASHRATAFHDGYEHGSLRCKDFAS
jgi:predicted metalloprotease